MALALTSSPRQSHPTALASARPTTKTRSKAQAFTVLLGQRYGDGLVYLQGQPDRVLLGEAIAQGLVNDEGYLTPAGYRFWVGRADP